MKLLSVILLSSAALAFAADQPAQNVKNPATPPDANGPKVYKKLGAVTWDPDAHKLAWTVETGNLVNGEFVAVSKNTYEISPDDATMGTAGEKRGFDNEEAAQLHRLLDILSIYCAESVAWWDGGAGTPVDSQPAGSDATSGKPVKVQQPAAPPAPPRQPIRLAPGQAIAER